MDKLEKIKKIKFIYSLVIQLFVYLFSELFEFDNIFIVVAINSIIYFVPYYYTVFIIRQYKATDHKRICKIDLIYYLIPSVLVCPLYESVAVILTKKTNESNGLFSVIMIFIYLLIYLMYILIYKINIKHIKKHQ